MTFVDLATGCEFGGRYRVVRRLASGGMGTVYEVVHLETERRRALKVMQADLFGDAALRERFRHEARVTAAVRSESLVDVFDAGVDPGTGMPFLVMELLIGEDLERRVDRLGPCSPEEVVTYLTQVASALDKTHAASIVHRDLKPANLFLAEQEGGVRRVKILDFGIAKIVSEATSEGVTGRSLGTPAYMAPEQLLGQPVSAATDIHALGLIAYTLLVGESYWQKDVESVDNVFALALRAQDGPRESPVLRAARKGRTLPGAFGDWFERATAREPKARFSRASSAVAALAEALGVRGGPGAFTQGISLDTPAEAPAVSSPLSGVRWLALPAALFVTLGLVLLLQRPGESPSAPQAKPVSQESAGPPPSRPKTPADALTAESLPAVPRQSVPRATARAAEPPAAPLVTPPPRPVANGTRTSQAPARQPASPPPAASAAPAATVATPQPPPAATVTMPAPPREKAQKYTRD
ncbi:MAG TPA: serine/threonine-protein kinase [Polyangiaceae bacterium]